MDSVTEDLLDLPPLVLISRHKSYHHLDVLSVGRFTSSQDSLHQGGHVREVLMIGNS